MRPVSYLTREGQARKPPALVLILELRDDGADRFLKRPEILKSMTDELTQHGRNAGGQNPMRWRLGGS